MKSILKIFVVLALILTIVSGLVSCSPRWKENSPAVKIIDIKLTDEQYAFVCKKGNSELVDSINSFMEEIKAKYCR